jgi:alanine dehydrogenase
MQPVMSADWLEPGMHLTGNGSRAIDPRAEDRCDVIVKLGWGAPDTGVPPSEGGSIGIIRIGTPEQLAHIPRGGHGGAHRSPHPHLVDLLTGRVPGRTRDDQISYFHDEGSQGLQFAAVGGVVYQRAHERGLGREIPNDWLLQDIRD